MERPMLQIEPITLLEIFDSSNLPRMVSESRTFRNRAHPRSRAKALNLTKKYRFRYCLAKIDLLEDHLAVNKLQKVRYGQDMRLRPCEDKLRFNLTIYWFPPYKLGGQLNSWCQWPTKQWISTVSLKSTSAQLRLYYMNSPQSKSMILRCLESRWKKQVCRRWNVHGLAQLAQSLSKAWITVNPVTRCSNNILDESGWHIDTDTLEPTYHMSMSVCPRIQEPLNWQLLTKTIWNQPVEDWGIPQDASRDTSTLWSIMVELFSCKLAMGTTRVHQ